MKQNMTKEFTEKNLELIRSITDLQKLNNEILQTMTKEQLNTVMALIDAESHQFQDLCESRSMIETVTNQCNMVLGMGKVIINSSHNMTGAFYDYQCHCTKMMEKSATAFFENTMTYWKTFFPFAQGTTPEQPAKKEVAKGAVT